MITIDNFNKKKLYWLFQGVGWLLFYLIYVSIASYVSGFKSAVFLGYLNTVLVGLLITHFYRAHVKKYNWLRLGLFKLAVRVLLASFVLAVIWSVVVLPINFVFFQTNADSEFSWFMALLVTFNLSIMILGWSLIYFLFQVFINFKRTEIEKWKLQAAVKDAELIALKSQINPHFIFNSLNNIRSLVVENPEKARDMITHLSGLLRYSIQFNDMEKVSLESELEIVQNYLNLESIQLEDRLNYKLEIKPETLDLEIPPMAVQLLVENAIKHGISDLPDGGTIHIKSYLGQGALTIEVINSGQLKTTTNSTGIGLKNASDRLKLLFGKLSDLKIENLDSNFVSARFTIPLT
ncbi:sensor histidine kinase [Fulvivirga sediminis]|uniref:Histidine kinase n=1 Tax=Fulvivirga sediminis TaxID=2803949 RepID=A0A937F404_9BACT|nr:histidine kinase [Fulvivirga sediminis]MBL3654601.1 histidine kinase [Fulvivirga sediminis]